MADITATMVRDLRDRTGVAMMDCKAALVESQGDMEKAADLLRKRGRAKQDKIASREAKEGRSLAQLSACGKKAVVVEISTNTDFTAKSEPVSALLKMAATKLLADSKANMSQDPEFQAALTAAVQKTGENISLRRATVIVGSAKAAVYNHFTGKIGVAVAVGGEASDEVIKDLCLHIAASRPVALKREEIPADLVSREQEIATEQAKAAGKPERVAKIVEGKLNAFFQERVLVEQKFAKDESKTISQMIGKNCTIEAFLRYEVGQA